MNQKFAKMVKDLNYSQKILKELTDGFGYVISKSFHTDAIVLSVWETDRNDRVVAIKENASEMIEWLEDRELNSYFDGWEVIGKETESGECKHTDVKIFYQDDTDKVYKCRDCGALLDRNFKPIK